MATKHEDFITHFLEQHKNKSFIGTELIDVLQKQYPELSSENCRRIIHNASKHDKITSSKPITFANNQYAYFSNSNDFGYKILSNSIREHKKALHRIIFALERNHGVLTFLDAQKISGATLEEHSHHISFNSLVKDLKDLGLAETHTMQNTNFITHIQNNVMSLPLENIFFDLKSDNLLLTIVLNWLTHSNLVDSKQLCYMGEANFYNGVTRNNEAWDAFGFSNVLTIGNSEKKFQTLVLMDFQSQHTYEEYDFCGFKERIDRVVFSTKGSHRKVLPIIFSNKISPVALSLIKRSGYTYFDISSLLGRDCINITRCFTRNAENIEKKITCRNSDFTEDILYSLSDIRNSGNETNYGNLKGTLFEYLMFPVLQKIYGYNSSITHSYSGKIDGQEFECDYLIETIDENIIIELKGYQYGNTILRGDFDQNTHKYPKNTIRWFLNQTFHPCSKALGNRKANKFCYITTANLEEAAKNELISRKKNKPDKLECFYTYDSLIKLLKDNELNTEADIIKQYYS